MKVKNRSETGPVMQSVRRLSISIDKKDERTQAQASN